MDWKQALGESPAQLALEMRDLLLNVGAQVQKMQAQCGARAKSAKDVLTEADLWADAQIAAWIAQRFPKHNTWLEESGLQDRGSDFQWLADPIDGTVNYSRGLPLWGIALALLYRGEPVVSACYLPALGESYWAWKEGGAWCNSQPIQVSTVQDASLALVSNGDVNVGDVQGFGPLNQLIRRDMEQQAISCQRVKSLGSAVVEGCWVAAGRLDAYVMRLSHPWDVAATALLTTEAGGKVVHLSGAPFRIVDLCDAVFYNGQLSLESLTVGVSESVKN